MSMKIIRWKRTSDERENHVAFTFKARFGGSLFNRFKPAPHGFYFEMKQDASRQHMSKPPCDINYASEFNPNSYQLPTGDWFYWLTHANLNGKAVVTMRFAGYYASHMPIDPLAAIHESLVCYIKFTEKSDAAHFKLVFGCPELKRTIY